MSHNPYTMQAVAAIRYQEQLKQAEQDRLARQACAGQAGLVRRTCATLLLTFGAKLTRMGKHLCPPESAQLIRVPAKRR